MTQTYKKMPGRHLFKILAFSKSQTIGKLGSGVASVQVAHNLGYIPAFDIFYQSNDDHPERWFPMPQTYENYATTMQGYDKSSFSWSISKTAFNFNVVNEDSKDHVLKLVILVYAERGVMLGS